MSIFTVFSFFVFVTNASLAIFIFLKNRRKKYNVIWGSLCFFAALWGYAGINFSTTLSPQKALYWWKIGYVGVILTPLLYFHFITEYLKIERKVLLCTAYGLAAFYLTIDLLYTDLFLSDLRFAFNQFYWGDWLKSKSLYYITFYIFFYWVLLPYSFVLLLKKYRRVKGNQKNQLKYFIVGSIVGWFGAECMFLPDFRLDFFHPLPNLFVAIYPAIMTYAIIRYRLMDITMAFTRTSIFLFVYSLVLGIPFAIGFGLQEKLIALFAGLWWVVPLVFSTILATGGPFIYMYLQKSTEDQIYKNQRQYQNTLRKASLGMGRIKDLKRLLSLIVHVVTRTVRIDHCSIYVFHESSGQYVLKAKKDKSVERVAESVFTKDSQLVKYLEKVKEPILYEEVLQRSGETGGRIFGYLAKTMRDLEAALILPSFVEQRLIAFLVLGAKRNKELYNHEDLVVFSILANQSGLAIENAQFYDDMKKTHAQLFKAEKMATIGTMADGLSHQMNNRLHAMGFIAGDALDSVRLKRDQDKPTDTRKFLDELEHSLKRIEDNVKRGGEIAEGLLRYTRKGAEGFSPVHFNKLLDASLEMIQFKINMRNLDLIKDFKDDLPPVKGNFTQLQEAFFNMIDNAYDAMMQRRDELKEPGYRPKLIISAAKKGKNLEILIKDNGMGVKEENITKLFTPFFTTKLSSKKGTGLGLYVIRQIIEENHNGRVKFTSVYLEGSQTSIILPVAELSGQGKKEKPEILLKNVKKFL